MRPNDAPMYTEKEKNEARESALRIAVESLTKSRKDSVIATEAYFDRLKSFMQNKSPHPDDRELISRLSTETENAWKAHLRANIGQRAPSELRVAYLAGPNPKNDVKVLRDLGVLPENIWAFEMNAKTYKQAVDNLLKRYPQIKIIRGKIKDFFRISPMQFDIVYLDFCDPLIPTNSKNENFETLLSLFLYGGLRPLSALITNFSFPDNSNDAPTYELILKMMALYLYPKPTVNDGGSVSEDGLSFFEWYRKVEDNPLHFYGVFIQRMMMDLTFALTPLLKLCKHKSYFDIFFSLTREQEKLCRDILVFPDDFRGSNALKKMQIGPCWLPLEELPAVLKKLKAYLSNEKPSKLEDDSGGWLYEREDFFAIPWFLEMAHSEDIRWMAENEEDKDEEEFLKEFFNNKSGDAAKFNRFKRCFDAMARSLSDHGYSCWSKNAQSEETPLFLLFLERLEAVMYLISGEGYGNEECLSEAMQEIMALDWNYVAPQACDVFTNQSVIGLLIGQLAFPYLINVLKSQGFSYQGKKTRMFTDVWILDSCRYLYDMLPTIDMLINRLSDDSAQICYRLALDALDKNFIQYNHEFFWGSAVAGANLPDFKAREFPERQYIN